MSVNTCVFVSICVSCAFSLDRLLLSICFVLPGLSGFVFILFYFTLFHYYSLDVCFIARDRKGVNLNGRGGGENLKRVGGDETVIKTYCMKQIYFP